MRHAEPFAVTDHLRIAIANIAGAVAPFLFPAKDAPR